MILGNIILCEYVQLLIYLILENMNIYSEVKWIFERMKMFLSFKHSYKKIMYIYCIRIYSINMCI